MLWSLRAPNVTRLQALRLHSGEPRCPHYDISRSRRFPLQTQHLRRTNRASEFFDEEKIARRADEMIWLAVVLRMYYRERDSHKNCLESSR
jgi:hypothetical protein